MRCAFVLHMSYGLVYLTGPDISMSPERRGKRQQTTKTGIFRATPKTFSKTSVQVRGRHVQPTTIYSQEKERCKHSALSARSSVHIARALACNQRKVHSARGMKSC